MAWSHTRNITDCAGLKMVTGVYTSTSSTTGGDIVTGLKTVYGMWLQPQSSAVVANQPAVYETFPLSNTGGACTIVTTAAEVGNFIAIGI